MQAQRKKSQVLPGKLRAIAPFAGLESEHLIVAAGRMGLIGLTDGDTLLRRGANDPQDYFLLEGKVELIDCDGERRLIEAGSASAGERLAGNRPSLYEVRAQGRAVCASMDRDDVALLQAQGHPASASSAADDLDETRDFVDCIEAELRAEKLRLPSPPYIATRIREALTRTSANNRTIAAVLSGDPAIAAKILRMANSPLCRGVEPVATLEDAVGRIGLFTVGELVTCFSLKDLFRCEDTELRRRFAERTSEAVRIGACAAVIAERSLPAMRERALVAGLLCDVGAIPVLEYLARSGQGPHDLAAITRTTDQLAPMLGATICERWSLGDDMAGVVAQLRNWTYQADGPPDLAELVICARYHVLLSLKRMQELPKPGSVPALRVLGEEISAQASMAVVREAKSRIELLLSLLA